MRTILIALAAMTMLDIDELLAEIRAGLRAMGATPKQITELEQDPARAAGWVRWAKREGKRINAVVAEFRRGEEAPDPDAWYEQQGAGTGKRGPDYPALLRAAESLVESSGHELSDADLVGEEYEHRGEMVRSEGELDRLARSARVGNGAALTEADVSRLLAKAARLRAKAVAAVPARDRAAEAWTAGYYVRGVVERRWTRKHVEVAVLPRLRRDGKADLADTVARELDAVAVVEQSAPAEEFAGVEP
jgi:hypothetical protein